MNCPNDATWGLIPTRVLSQKHTLSQRENRLRAESSKFGSSRSSGNSLCFEKRRKCEKVLGILKGKEMKSCLN